ncbi:MAG: SurA N-terminal domain-containing protein [Pseudomonadota bacterium]
MFDFVHNNKRLIQIILGLVMLPFLFFGIESYLQSSRSGNYVAKIGDGGITEQAYTRAIREQQERLSALLKDKATPEQLNRPEMRAAVLENLIRKHLLSLQARHNGLMVSDAQLQKEIAAIPAFQENGQFSVGRYQSLLANQNMTPTLFEERMREELLQEQVANLYTDAGFVSKTVAERLLLLSQQQREISLTTLPAGQFLPQVKLPADAAMNYYNGHAEEFRVPEQARVEYLVLSLDQVTANMQVTPEELKQYYAENAAQLQQGEERRTAHILIAVPPSADSQAREAARKQAADIAAQAKKNPAAFAQLAKKYSQDTDSAERGGDLGEIKRGMSPEMKPIEDAVFAMKPGEVSNPVQSGFGYHIVKLMGTKNAKTPPLEQVKSQLEAELKKQKASKQFAEMADNFSNLVYEQSDSLKPAADALKLTIQQSGWLSRDNAANPLLGNPKLLSAIFSSDAVQDKRNTEAVEAAPNTLVAARIVEYKPASTRPFDEVSKAIVDKLTREEAHKLAIAAGQAKLDQLTQGKDVGLAWGPAQTISRERNPGISSQVLQQVFRTDTGKLPAYAGVETPQGYTLVRISKIIEPGTITDEQRRAFTLDLFRLAAQDEFASYLATLRANADVQIKIDLGQK